MGFLPAQRCLGFLDISSRRAAKSLVTSRPLRSVDLLPSNEILNNHWASNASLPTFMDVPLHLSVPFSHLHMYQPPENTSEASHELGNGKTSFEEWHRHSACAGPIGRGSEKSPKCSLQTLLGSRAVLAFSCGDAVHEVAVAGETNPRPWAAELPNISSRKHCVDRSSWFCFTILVLHASGT